MSESRWPVRRWGALSLARDARGATRLDPDGDLVLLADQDRAAWDQHLVREGLARSTAALGAGPSPPGGSRCRRPSRACTPWPRAGRRPTGPQVVATYDALPAVWPSPVVVLNRAVARTRVPGADLARYPYLPVARAHVLDGLGRHDEAAAARVTALALTTDPAERRFLAR